MKLLELYQKLLRKGRSGLSGGENGENEGFGYIIQGNGKAEFLGVGTYEEYEKESEVEQSWSKWLKNTLKIDRRDV